MNADDDHPANAAEGLDLTALVEELLVGVTDLRMRALLAPLVRPALPVLERAKPPEVLSLPIVVSSASITARGNESTASGGSALVWS